MKTLIMSLIVAGGCVIYGSGVAEAFTIDWSGCGPGSMCTNSGYICR